MRLGINIPNELYDRFKPLKGIYNLSQVCRDAITAKIDSYEKAKEQAEADGMADLANRLWHEYSKGTILDWEAIGRESAKKWAETATLQDFKELFHNIGITKSYGRGHPGEYLYPRQVSFDDRFEAAMSKHQDWFDRMFEIDPDTNHNIVAKEDYDRGWLSYLTVVWQMLQDKIEVDAKARLIQRQAKPPQPLLPESLKEEIEN